MTLFLMGVVNLLVGVCVGLTGIAGFLLPMFYTGFLDMPSSEALALSFAAFLVSGAAGSVNYYKSGNLDLKAAGILSAGSFAGAVAGVKLNLLIPEETVKTMLYLVVLLSGISILLRKEKKEEKEKKREKKYVALSCSWRCDRGGMCGVRSRRTCSCNAASYPDWFSGTYGSGNFSF